MFSYPYHITKPPFLQVIPAPGPQIGKKMKKISKKNNYRICIE